jgi:branched-chain amino acid transport system ATP-binding protein
LSALLEIRALEGGYGRLTVFRDVGFSLAAGETIGVLGANGAGKTTLMKTLAGAQPASRGQVLLSGVDVTALAAYQRARSGLALVPEGRHVLTTLTVQDNLELTRAIEGHRAGLTPFEERLAEVYGLFPRLKERARQLAGSLSGGEQQMLAIARALLLKPDVLMLDEPTQGLAPIIIRSLADTLKALRGRFAMIVVEQNKVFLEGLADRVLHMRAGNLTEGASA